jgi:Sulfotransferase domain
VKSPVRPIMMRIANKSTKLIVMLWGETFPMYCITEYPKSGGTWFGRMAADCLQIPLPQHSVMPIGMEAIVHNHWRYSPRLRRVFYMYRDGRDIMVSLFFHRMRRIAEQRNAHDRVYKRTYDRLFGPGYDPNDVSKWLARFIEHEFRNPRDSRLTWPQHIEDWYDPQSRPHIAYFSYEQLLAETAPTLKTALEHLSGRAIDDWRIQAAVDKYAMARQTGRRPGQEDRASFIRKGVAGDWVNHFTPEAARIFGDKAGPMLIRLGYEPDDAWVSRLGRPAPEPQVQAANGR